MSRDLPPELVRELFNYGPELGVLSWRLRPASHFSSHSAAKTFNTRFFGQAVGSPSGQGYLIVHIKGRLYQVHRLVWIFINGEINGEIDHINGIRDDNRVSNLRDVTRTGNSRNAKLSIRNKSGRVGVRWDRNSRKWIAEIRAEGISKRLGRFEFFSDADSARKSAEMMNGYHENHGRIAP